MYRRERIKASRPLSKKKQTFYFSQATFHRHQSTMSTHLFGFFFLPLSSSTSEAVRLRPTRVCWLPNTSSIELIGSKLPENCVVINRYRGRREVETLMRLDHCIKLFKTIFGFSNSQMELRRYESETLD